VYTLDTNAIIYYATGEATALPSLIPIIQSEMVLIVPAIVVTELWSSKHTSSAEMRIIENLLHTMLVVSFDEVLAKNAGILRREYNLSLGDSLIAATTLATGTTLLTRNVKDFQHVPGLSIEAI